jgi:hypothetical protein
VNGVSFEFTAARFWASSVIRLGKMVTGLAILG